MKWWQLAIVAGGAAVASAAAETPATTRVAETRGAGEAARVVDRHGNVVIASPFAGDKALEAKRVTLTFDPGRALTIAQKLAAEAGVDVVTGTGDLTKTADFRVEQMPWLEAFLSFQAETGAVAAIRDNRLLVSMPKEPALPGAWSVAGPFGVVITDVKHNLSRATVAGGVEQEGDKELFLQGYPLVEPRLKVLQYPGTISIEQVDDELGHSLIVRDGEGKPVVRTDLKYSHDTIFTTMRIGLRSVPEIGKRIKVLKGTVAFLVQTEMEPLVLEDPFGMKETVKRVKGMVLTFSPAVWEEETQRWTMKATFSRGGMAEEQWNSTKQALAGMRPRLVMSDKTQNKIDRSWTQVTAEGEVTAKYMVWLPRARGGPPAGKPEVPRVEFDLPTAAREVAVPVEFRDLALR